MRASLLLIAFTALLSVPAFAEGAADNSAATSEQAVVTPAGKFIQTLGDRAVKIVADKDETPEQRSQKYHAMLHENFDLPTIGHFVLGRAWNTATSAQQTEYMKLFEALVVKTYGDRLNFYSGEGFRVVASRPESDSDIIVGSEITHADGSQPTHVDWRVRQKNGKLGVIDVVVEGVSQSVTQRQEYTSIIQRNGGDIEPLLVSMRQSLQQSQQQAENP